MKFSSFLCLTTLSFLSVTVVEAAAVEDYQHPQGLCRQNLKQEQSFTVQYLSVPENTIPCPNEGELFCATGQLTGDWVGSSTVRFDNFVIDPAAGAVSYSGKIDICVSAVKTAGGIVTPKQGCVTGSLSNGILQTIRFTNLNEPIFSVLSEVSVTPTDGGTGFFKKLTCDSINTGSIDPSRTPYGEVLDFAMTCRSKED